MQIERTEDRVWSLRKDYSNALRAAGYVEVIENKPHIAINHILRKLIPSQLHRRMLDIMSWRKNENSPTENSNRFLRKVVAQADKLQTGHPVILPLERNQVKKVGYQDKKTFRFIETHQPRTKQRQALQHAPMRV